MSSNDVVVEAPTEAVQASDQAMKDHIYTSNVLPTDQQTSSKFLGMLAAPMA
jgi:hypothetical protein